MIPIQHTFCHIEQIALTGPLAVCSVCALKKKKTLVFVHSPGSVSGKQSGSDQAIKNPRQSTFDWMSNLYINL